MHTRRCRRRCGCGLSRSMLVKRCALTRGFSDISIKPAEERAAEARKQFEREAEALMRCAFRLAQSLEHVLVLTRAPQIARARLARRACIIRLRSHGEAVERRAVRLCQERACKPCQALTCIHRTTGMKSRQGWGYTVRRSRLPMAIATWLSARRVRPLDVSSVWNAQMCC
jgi:hypothetical protein